MKNYEHKVVTSNSPEHIICSMERKGWKLCAVVRLEDPVRELYFHRPVEGEKLTVASLTRKCATASAMVGMQ